MADVKNENKMPNEEEAAVKKSEEPATVIKEKIVYKVVHVPYYYPVPVDADYYYKNQERFLRQPEKFNEHFMDNIPPPPPLPPYYRRSRDGGHHYGTYHGHEHGRHRYSSRSPSPRYFESRYNGDRSSSNSPVSSKEKEIEDQLKKNKIKKEMDEQKDSSDDNNSNNKNNNIDKKDNEPEQNGKDDKPKNESETKEDENQNTLKEKEKQPENEENDEENSLRRKKRYLMTFPYDQRQKEGERKRPKYELPDQSVPDEFIRHENGHYKRPGHYYSSHPPSPPDAPFVMVPMRPVGLHRPEYGHERRCHSEIKDRRDEKHRHHDMAKSDDNVFDDANNNISNLDDENESKDIRYHTNGRRVRTVFTRQQLLTLNNVFQKHPFVSGERMSELSSQLGLDRKIVKIWFQNKRQNARKKGSLFERADDYYYDYHERHGYGHRSTPPTMAENW